MNKILIVEDEQGIADTIIYALQSEGFDTVHVLTGGQALKESLKSTFDLVILDVGLPDESGFEICKKIRKNSQIPVVFLTARSDEIDKIIGFELGADDYVPKPFSPRELVSRVKAIIRRSSDKTSALSDKNKKLTPFIIDDARVAVSFRDKPLDLSRYEYRLLKVLIRSPGRVFSREQLMNLAWEEPDMSLERTVDAHIKSIRAKLRVISEEEIIITHRGFGYALKEDW
jgi:two-component system catabolic regulation response regulator CreB